MSVARHAARRRCLVLVGLAACAPTATPSGREPSPRRPAIGEAQPRPQRAVASAVRVSTPVPPPPPPAPPPPVVDAEQRAILDALEEVAKALEGGATANRDASRDRRAGLPPGLNAKRLTAYEALR